MRKAAHKTEVIETYFEKFRVVVAEKGIHKDDIYNFDEMGFRIRCARDVLVITYSTKSQVYTADPNNWELITAVECINARDFVIKSILIISSKIYLEKAFNNNLHNEIFISLSNIGYSNEVLGMYWLRHFNTQTLAQRQSIWRLLIFDSHISYLSYEFVSFCEAQNIVPFCLLLHSTHLL